MVLSFGKSDNQEVQTSLQRNIDSTSKQIAEIKLEIEDLSDKLRNTRHFEKTVSDSITQIRQQANNGDYESRLLLRTAIRDLIQKIVVYWVKDIPLYLIVYKKWQLRYY